MDSFIKNFTILILELFIWISLWSLFDMIIEYYKLSKRKKIITYINLIIISVFLLYIINKSF